jgi:hypothetical protein
VGLAALAGRDAADHLRAVGDGLFGMEGALLAGEALADDLGVLLTRMLIALLSISQGGSRRFGCATTG